MVRLLRLEPGRDVWRRHKLSRGEIAGRRFWKTGRVKQMMGSLPGVAAKTQGSTR